MIEPDLFRVIRLSLSFFLLFFAFNALQNLQTTVNKEDGSTALALLYVSFSICTIFSAKVVQKMGDLRNAIIVGEVCYIVFCVANIAPTRVALYASALGVGFGASILWTAHGTYLAQCSTVDNAGRNSGIFFCLFAMASVISSLSIMLIQSPEDGGDMSDSSSFSTTTFMIAVVVVSIGAPLLALSLTRPSRQLSADAGGGTGDVAVSPLATLRLFRSRLARLAPLMLYSGFSQTLYYAILPYTVHTFAGIGATMAAFSASNSVNSLLLGKLGDKVGRVWALLVGCGCTIVGCTLFIVAGASGGSIAIYIASAVFLAAGDGAVNTQLYALVKEICKEVDDGDDDGDAEREQERIAPVVGMAFLKLNQSASAALFYALSLHMSAPLTAAALPPVLVGSILAVASGRKGGLCGLGDLPTYNQLDMESDEEGEIEGVQVALELDGKDM